MPMQSPLHEIEKAAGANFSETAGWSLPHDYGDFEAEYAKTIENAGLFDCTSATKLQLMGADAAMFLGNLSTNDIKSLPPGGGCEAYFCDSRAKVQFQAWIARVPMVGDSPAMWVESTPGRNEEFAKYLDKYLISERVEIADRTLEFAQLHLAGTRAHTILEAALSDNLPPLAEFNAVERTFGSNATSMIRRRNWLGLPGYDLICKNEFAVEIWSSLTATGAIPAGSRLFETLRIEAGTPFFGPDIDANRFVMEVGYAARAVSYSKGCYLGQEPIVMARDRAGHVNRAFLGLKVLEGEPLPSGAKLWRDGQEVGVVTSSIHSPQLGVPIALGYIKWKHQEPGTRMEAETPSGRQAVELVGLPPVRSSHER